MSNAILMEGLETFERMIDRFQLRRAPSKRSSLTHKFSDVSPIEEQASQSQPSAESSDRSSHISRITSKPIPEHGNDFTASWITTIRLVGTSLVLVANIIYRPFAQAYSTNHTQIRRFDAFVWFVFVANFILLRSGRLQLARLQPVKAQRFRSLVTGLIHTERQAWQWLPMSVQFVTRYACVRYQFALYMRERARDVVAAESSLVGAILFSRYCYLFRIASSIVSMVMFAHFIACVWSSLQPPSVFDAFDSAFDMHLHSVYEALQLLQGQGVTTSTPLQDAFGSIAVLIGSVVLAVVYANLAVLVANFNANQAIYQRKRERVLAVMDKLQLPAPLRERVHQYYEYLHAEYESLDGEVATFTKELSHTLQLEVVLFKYMDVVMHVSHWRECSPDFQKQLVLAMGMRVCLPDDFIMRRGEVGADCFVVSRGTCKQYMYEGGNWEQTTMAVQLSGDHRPRNRRLSRV